MEEGNKGTVCVTGGTGYVASWLIMRLLQQGYSVNTTVRTNPADCYLKDLPGASERLRIFKAELDKPESFAEPIKGCIGVFHIAHPMEFDEEESEETKTNRAVKGMLGILQACLEATTVRRVVYTASTSAVNFSGKSLDMIDESTWTDVDYFRSLKLYGGGYVVSKTLAEKTALEFGEKHGLDVLTVLPTWIHGPFIGPRLPNSVDIAMALIFGKQDYYTYLVDTSFVHIDDVASAHIFLFENPNAKGRYICSAVETTIDKLHQFLSSRYPEYHLPDVDSLKDIPPVKFSGFSSKKLMDARFKYTYGLEEMFDGAIESCKQKGFL